MTDFEPRQAAAKEGQYVQGRITPARGQEF